MKVVPESHEEIDHLLDWHVADAWDTYLRRHDDRSEAEVKKCIKLGKRGELEFSMLSQLPATLSREVDNGVDFIDDKLGQIQVKTMLPKTADVSKEVFYVRDDFPASDYCYLVIGVQTEPRGYYSFFYQKPSVLHAKKKFMLNDLFPWKSREEAFKRLGKLAQISNDDIPEV